MANPVLEHDGGLRALTSPDLWFDDVRLAVMVQSKQYHAASLDWDATVEYGSDLRIGRHPGHRGHAGGHSGPTRGRQLLRIEQAHASARLRGRRPDVRARPGPSFPAWTRPPPRRETAAECGGRPQMSGVMAPGASRRPAMPAARTWWACRRAVYGRPASERRTVHERPATDRRGVGQDQVPV